MADNNDRINFANNFIFILFLTTFAQVHQSVFETPSSLPPPRSHDHVILLIDGSTPVKVKPYRYLHSQKDEIERLVHGMLGDGIIQHSKSPFSSPIILVKKKDGSWRLVMPFGLMNAPATFQSLMNEVFKGVLRKFHDHLSHLEFVLQTLQQQQLYARLSKCSFGVVQIDYLGHVLSGAGVAMETSKLEAINNWPQPMSLKQLRGFLGVTGYYRRFIRNYASMAGPLTDLLKKNSFHWSELASKAFLQLKQAMTFAPVLAIPNFKEPFILETDASTKHAILAYFSKKLSPRMQKQSTYAREFYAITEALAKFRHYLLGHKFIIKTDQKSLKELLEQTLQTPEQQ
ncbi:hypothetical protein V8G54_014312 [Vigna mungo]|uniref:Reverse transcriptase/retrotransposon-derived protein RNase H-like domain-containing protein n=1 Tax=Vigna mungo TaxID=3915 RepID=A0AAQ3RXC4_VIGMU